MPLNRPIHSSEVSQKDQEHARLSAGQYLLGGLALFGVARALPRLIERMPGLRSQLTEGLTSLARRTDTEAVTTFFNGLNLYAGKRSAIFSNMEFGQRLEQLPHELDNLRESFRIVRQNPEQRSAYFAEDAVAKFNQMVASVRRVHNSRETADQIFVEWHNSLLAESERRGNVSRLGSMVDLRHLTIGDALKRGNLLTDERARELQGFAQSAHQLMGGDAAYNRFMNLPLDHRVFVGHDNNLVDFRGLMKAYDRTTDIMATDWNVPFVRINPFTILGFNQTRTLQKESFAHLFPVLSEGPSLYNLERGRPAQGTTGSIMGFVGGKMLEVNRAGEFNVSDGWHLTTPGSQFGQHIRRMRGLGTQKYAPKSANHPLLGLADHFDLFRQELEPEELKLTTVDSWFPALFNKVLNRISPYQAEMTWADVHERLPQWADPKGGPDNLKREIRMAFRKSSVSLENPNFPQLFRELGASAKRDPENITTATMIGYTFAYKVNVALNQIGLGFSGESMPSTVDFFRNLVSKRVLPAIALFYGWRAVNETMGDASPGSAAAIGVKGWQDVVSGTATVLGLPARMKRLGQLLPGIDQITEFPIIPLPNNHGEISVLTLKDILPVHMTINDLQDERRYGMTPIRRNRYWSVGNSPYTGSDIIGFAPNWSRITNLTPQTSAYGGAPRRGHLSTGGLGAGNTSGVSDGTPGAGGGLDGDESGDDYLSVSGPMGSLRLEGSGGSAAIGYDGDQGALATGGKLRGPLAQAWHSPAVNLPDALKVASSAGRQLSDILGFTGFALRTASGVSFSRHNSAWSIGGVGNTLWHSQLGGFGGTISEVVRRFFPAEPVDDSKDMTPSGMPSWLPGDGSFTNFQRGHAYEKVPMGRYVLPGSEFNALWHLPPPNLALEAGSLGTGAVSPYSPVIQGDPAEARRIAEQMKAEGMETSRGGRVVNAPNQVYTDVPFFTQQEGKPIPSFLAAPGEEAGGPTWRRASFAAAQLGVPQALVFSGQGAGLSTQVVQPDHNHLRAQMQQAERDRTSFMSAARQGNANGMELYHPAYRLLVLASVAPHSNEFQETSRLLQQLKLTPELERVVKQARTMASANGKRLRVYPYQFINQEMKTVTGRVEQVLDGERILIQGMPNPIRLAGLQALPGEPGQQAAAYLHKVLQSGHKVRLQIGSGESWKLGRNQMVRAVIQSGGLNVNRELIRMGLAVEDEDDTSAAAMQVRFSPAQRFVGGLWERFAHLNTPFHTKFLHVRSPVEDYIDREVFGKSFQSWDRPIDDFLVPTFQSIGHHGLLKATLIGATVGYAFGAGSMGRLAFSALGAVGGALTAVAIKGNELVTGHPWTPERRQKQWALEEYIDALRYVKALRNFNTISAQAKREEGFDVNAYIQSMEQRGSKNKTTSLILQAKKRRIQQAGAGANAQGLAAELQLPGEYATMKDLEHAVNGMLAGLTTDRNLKQVGPIAAQALSWYAESKRTIQGWHRGDPIDALVGALPTIDRKYFPELLKATEKELRQLEPNAPAYLMRAVRLARGEDAPRAHSLSQVFAEHGLPDPNWEGWRPEVDLGDVRIKIVRREGMDEHGMGIYPQEIERAGRSGIVNIPRVFDYPRHPSAGEIEKRLRGLLGSSGVQYSIDITPGGDGLRVELEHEHDRRGHIQQMLFADGIKLDH